MTHKVLIACHDRSLTRLMEPMLTMERYAVSIAEDADAALEFANAKRPELVILDRMLPPMGGIFICKQLRLRPDLAETTVIMFSTNDSVSDRILGLDVGADDYLTSPFDMEELLARINALLRRKHQNGGPRILKAGVIEMDLDRWVVTIEGQPLNLTIKEARLLQELLEAKGRVLTRDVLLERVWGHEKDLDIYTRTIDVHVGRLRNKLGPLGSHIITVRNIGYRIDISPDWITR